VAAQAFDLMILERQMPTGLIPAKTVRRASSWPIRRRRSPQASPAIAIPTPTTSAADSPAPVICETCRTNRRPRTTRSFSNSIRFSTTATSRPAAGRQPIAAAARLYL